MRAEDAFVSELEEIRAVHAEARVAAAREDFPTFCEYAMVDDQGKPWRFAPHQYEWSALMDDTSVDLLEMVGPRGCAKSTTLQARCLWEIGRNPDICIKYVCGNDPKAIDRLHFLRRNFDTNQHYRKVFPHIRPADIAERSKHKLTVVRPAGLGLQDATVEAASVSAGGTGGRCHLLVLDDVIDSTDALNTPSLMAKTKKFVEGDWMSTLHPGGRVWLIGTFWSFDPPDLYVEYRDNPIWKSWVEPACGVDLAGNLCEPILWREKWPLEELVKRRYKVGEDNFFQQYLLRGAVQRSQLFSPEHIAACKTVACSLGEAPEPYEIVKVGIGLDPATSRKKTGSFACIFVLGLLQNGCKIPLAIIRVRADAEVVAEAVVQQWIEWSKRMNLPTKILVENNATQESFVSLIRVVADRYGHGEPPVSGRFTGKTKWNPDGGLPTINVEFGQRKWIIPFGGDHQEAFHECPVCLWVNEMKFWGKIIDALGRRVTSDTIMASWLASAAVDDANAFGDVPIVVATTVREVRFGPPRRAA